MIEKKNRICIYTDGACKGNPGPGGWGVLIIGDNVREEFFGYEKLTTNNRMELIAAIKALNYFSNCQEIILYTDSTYLKLGITDWIKTWKKNDWKNKQKKNIKNLDLWKKLDFLNNFHNVNWNWVKAHDGNPGNEKADLLANKAIALKKKTD
tara:strand:- start:860 stop:1315 length:456 start_codon:yes stop_codon:yes gene_type:complete